MAKNVHHDHDQLFSFKSCDHSLRDGKAGGSCVQGIDCLQMMRCSKREPLGSVMRHGQFKIYLSAAGHTVTQGASTHARLEAPRVVVEGGKEERAAATRALLLPFEV
eukprot:scaffold41523_cov18-Tisochrysis_lutea.AAC.1